MLVFQRFIKTTLENITIPHSVTKIENEAYYRTGLSSMIIPNSVSTIHNHVFAYCNNLTEVYIPESVESIGEGNFLFCLNLESATVCSKETGFGTFYNCINLANVELSDNVEKISGSTFYGCKSLETIELGDSITLIHYGAFWECEKLKSITIPQNVKYLGNLLLGGCLSLESVVSLIDKPVEVRYDGDNPFGEINAEPVLYVPYGTKELYQIHEQWRGFKEIIEMNPTGISVISDDDCNASSNYSINGMKTSNTYKGLNIIRMNNRKTRKVMK